jgi:pyruvate dehydrogenase E1 component
MMQRHSRPSPDLDPEETREWIDALAGVLDHEGPERANFLIERLIASAREAGAYQPPPLDTPYVNTIPVERQARFPGDFALERTIRHYVRWNAMAMVVRANKHANLGGHIATFASAATLYEIGYNHFWRSGTNDRAGDLVFVQGHSSPGIYARAFLLGALSEEQLEHFRQEVGGKGLSSYPHPWLMPDFWQFPTVSMGLGPHMGVYQARFMRYLRDRGLVDPSDRKVWVFCGDGEMDEPEALGALGMAGREKLDNLIFVVNCNLQRLDGPVRGDGKIIQELERLFRGAGWNVIKVIWGRRWDPLLAKDKDGALARRMMEVVDGEYQTFKAKDGAYVREHFFNSPELQAMVAELSDDDIWALNRGGHDPFKVYAAYDAAVKHEGQPTVILAKTIKGYGLGEAGEAMNIAHQAKKVPLRALRHFRDRFDLPVQDDQLERVPFLRLPDGSPELEYMKARRAALGGQRPRRRRRSPEAALPIPPLSTFGRVLEGSGDREISTTMAFVECLRILMRDRNLGRRIVPIIPDESRTFGMEGLFRQLGIWRHGGQLYTPEDADRLMSYKESNTGQIIEEGITEAGGMCDWMAGATAYSVHATAVIPFFIFYSMFGFQRIGDLAWAAADMRSRGFLIGGTSGRTTLNGEGLQHEDGHSHVLWSVVPNCRAYDPTFGCELAVILQDGLRRMYGEQQDLFYYVTVMNENYAHPALPDGAAPDVVKGMYLFRRGATTHRARVQLLGSGTIFREVIAAASLLENEWGVDADLWSCPSFTELARDGARAARANMLNAAAERSRSHVEACLAGTRGPVVAATDYVRTFAEQIRAYVPRRYVVLGTDGFGRSDTRPQLRRFFEVDRYCVAVAALAALAEEGSVPPTLVRQAIDRYGIDRTRPPPWES